MNVIDVPSTLDHLTVDRLIEQLAADGDGTALFDAHRLRWIDPQGMIGLLAAGTVVRDRLGVCPQLLLPESEDVLGYLARMGFFRGATSIFAIKGRVPTRNDRESEVLLEITPITTNSDIHTVVDRVQSRAGTILSRTLHYPPSAVVRFSVILSEVCQNIIEHAEAPGWVAAQSYNYARRLGRHVLLIAVADLGRGFRESLAKEHAARFGNRWDDATALEAAFLHGVTRFADTGRGQGIQQIRRQVHKWDGMMSIRSGSARIADVPSWDDSARLEQNLAFFPGAQINILLPALIEHE